MNKKFYLAGLAILFGLALFVVGCPTDPETEYVDRWHDSESGGEDGGGDDTPVINLPEGTKTVTTLADLRDALNDEEYAYVALAANVTVPNGDPELVIRKPLYLLATLTSSPLGKISIQKPVYVEPNATLDVKNGVTVTGEGSIEVFRGGTLTVSDTVGVSDGEKTVLGSPKVKIYGTLDILVYTSGKIVTAVSYIEDGAKLVVDAGSNLSPSEAIEEIAAPPVQASVYSNAAVGGISLSVGDIGATNKAVAITANKEELKPSLTIRKEISVTTSALLNTLTTLTVAGKLSAPTATLTGLTELTVIGEKNNDDTGVVDAPAATGDATSGLVIDVGANANVTLGTTATIAAINTGSSVASGSTLTVGNVTTIEAITVSGGFTAGTVNTVNNITVTAPVPGEKEVPALELGPVANVTGTIDVPVGATMNGGTSDGTPITNAGDVVSASKREIGDDVFKVVKVGTDFADLLFKDKGSWNDASERILGIASATFNVLSAVYEPNKSGATADVIDTTETGRKAIAFTDANAISAAVLNLFEFTTKDGIITKVEIKGTTLPTATGASADNLIVIDIGLPGTETNAALANVPFYIPYQGLGVTGGSYPHIRFRVNRGAELVILADNSGYLGDGPITSCPDGFFNGGCVETMAGGKLRDGAYQGFPLGANAVLINRYGSYLSVGPEPDSADAKATTAYQAYYAGYLLGPQGTGDDMPRIVWDAIAANGNTASSYLEVRPGNIATNARLTVQISLGLIYSVFFIEDAHVTIDVAAGEAFDNGWRGLASNEKAGDATSLYRFYAKTTAEVILVKAGSMLDKRYLSTGTTAANLNPQTDIITGTSDISIVGVATGTEVPYVDASTGISGYLIPPPSAEGDND